MTPSPTSTDVEPVPITPASAGRPWRPWADPVMPISERVASLMAVMTLDEKLAQLGSVWPGSSVIGDVAPMQGVLAEDVDFGTATADGIGHLTRPFGSKPVDPAEGAAQLADRQRDLMQRTRLGIPALAHEECLTGFTTYRASVFPASIAWAATFDPQLVESMARAIGSGMRRLGVHQGLSPVLDVVRDYRWGRVEETLGEDPYLVGQVGAGYVRGLESAGIVATLKHFAGYSASRAARNHAPVSMGRREFADVILPPFETAIREGGARSVMNSYSDVDGVPAAADHALLTGILREEWGFTGTVVSDYWSLAFLRTMHRIVGSFGEAGAVGLRAGLDVELPNTMCFGEPLADLIRSGDFPVEFVDRSVERVLRQKAELGLLDADWAPNPVGGSGADVVDLDPPGNREIARLLAERSIILLDNPGHALPLSFGRSIALVGPCANDAHAFFGCYSFPNHVLPNYPDLPIGIEAPSLLEALRAELPEVEVVHATGCPVKVPDRSGIPAAVAAARAADICVAVVGDRAALFGLGTSGEGCDAEDLSLPGVQDELVQALLETGTPVVLVVVSGRPYALGPYVGRAAATVQAFFPGEEGGPAIAGVLSGRVNPSGKLPVQIPRAPGGQPGTYLAPPLGLNSEGISNLDPTPVFPFGHGLSYTTFDYSDLWTSAESIPTDGEIEISFTVTNSGSRAGTEIAQLYYGDPVAQITRPVAQLAGFTRVPLEPGERARVAFRLHADRTAFTGLGGRRIVEPGEITLAVGSSSTDLPLRGSVRLTGPVRKVGRDRVLSTSARIEAIADH